MIRQCRGILLFEVLDIRNSLVIFWSILVASMALSFGIQFSTGGNLTVSSGMAVYIFSSIAGFLTVKETYPTSIKMGATRRNYYVTTSLFLLMLALFMAASHTVMIIVLEALEGFGPGEFKLYYLSMVLESDLPYLTNFYVDTAVCFFLQAMFFILGSIFYRFGLLGGYAAIGLAAVLLFIPSVRDEFIAAVFKLLGEQALAYYGGLMGIGALLLVLGWFVLIKAGAKSVMTR
ncbi:hypothetical protein ACTSEZ_19335 [Metabacillus sp. JX24]|uniref:hypothetical protein n=1 Tax=Metabacillus sp. JX24 TaxID=3240759 RepID=UPI00350F0EE5